MTNPDTAPPTIVRPRPRLDAPAGSQLPLSGPSEAVDHNTRAAERGAPSLAGDQSGPEAQFGGVPGEGDPFTEAAEGEPAMLGLLAANVDDLEKTRIAVANRLGQATRSEPDSDGEVRGFGLDERNPYVRQSAVVLAALEEAERTAIRSLERAMRRHPLGPWVAAKRGVGAKQAARLLAVIGDPYIKPPQIVDDNGREVIVPARPRQVSELWALCGYHVLPARHNGVATQGGNAGGNQTGHPGQVGAGTHRLNAGVAPRRQRGVSANWNEEARVRARMIAESAAKQLDKTCPVDPEVKFAVHVEDCRCSEFRKVYDAGREKYLHAVHAAPCAQCGPAGSPAPAGSSLSDGHKHARALRLVAKEILKSLWVEARWLHTGVDDPLRQSA